MLVLHRERFLCVCCQKRANFLDQDTEISIIVPAFNERANLPLLVEEIRASLSGLCANTEIIIVDDGSTDDTWNVAVSLASNESHPPEFTVKGLRLSRNFGKESAMCAGLESAKGRAVVVMDSDLQHPPSLLPRMIEAWRANEADVVEAVRVDNQQAGPLRRIQNALFYGFFKSATGVELSRVTDFKLMDRSVLVAWMHMSERGVYFRGMTAWLGFRRKSIPFEVPKRVHGATRWSSIALIGHASNALVSFSVLPLRLVTILGGLFLAFSVFFTVYALVVKMLGSAFTGFTTVIILLLMIGGCIMTCLGLIGEYIGKIYSEVKCRPRYVVAETISSESCPVPVKCPGATVSMELAD